MAGGRPREYDIKKIGEDLVNWSKKPDSINFNKFCCTYEPMIPPTYLLRWAKVDEEFCIAYEKAKSSLGARREEMLNSENFHVKAYDLNATVYDEFLKSEKRQQAEFEADLAKKVAETPKNDLSTNDQNEAMEERHRLRMEIERLKKLLEDKS